MAILKVQGTGRVLGEISESQLQFLIDQLEEEHSKDQDYYLNKETLTMFEEQGCDPELLAMLRDAMGEADEVDIEWE